MRAHGRAVARESGFSLIELLVVMLIVGVLMAIAFPALNRPARATEAPQLAMAGGAIWRAINQYRADNHGVLPPVTMVVNASNASQPGTGFEDPGQSRYVRVWPRDRANTPTRVINGGTGAVPTAANYCASRRGRLVYGAASGTAPHTGWMVACSSEGRMVFRRSIMTTATAATRPIG